LDAPREIADITWRTDMMTLYTFVEALSDA